MTRIMKDKTIMPIKHGRLITKIFKKSFKTNCEDFSIPDQSSESNN